MEALYPGWREPGSADAQMNTVLHVPHVPGPSQCHCPHAGALGGVGMISEDSAIPLASPCALWFPSATSQELWAALGRAGVLRAVLWLSKARGHGLTHVGGDKLVWECRWW